MKEEFLGKRPNSWAGTDLWAKLVDSTLLPPVALDLRFRSELDF